MCCHRLRAFGRNDEYWNWGITGILRIPGNVGKLIHLRYLDFIMCRNLVTLPETLCELYNLQTLDLTGSEILEKLPHGMGRLINLRHLLKKFGASREVSHCFSLRFWYCFIKLSIDDEYILKYYIL